MLCLRFIHGVKFTLIGILILDVFQVGELIFSCYSIREIKQRSKVSYFKLTIHIMMTHPALLGVSLHWPDIKIVMIQFLPIFNLNFLFLQAAQPTWVGRHNGMKNYRIESCWAAWTQAGESGRLRGGLEMSVESSRSMELLSL